MSRHGAVVHRLPHPGLRLLLVWMMALNATSLTMKQLFVMPPLRGSPMLDLHWAARSGIWAWLWTLNPMAS